MNLVRVSYEIKNGRPYLVAGELAIPLSSEWAQRIERTAEKEFILGIRPEDMELSLKEQIFAFPGKVILIEPLGSGVLAHICAGLVRFRVLVSREKQTWLGDRVWVQPKLEKLHLFLLDGQSIREFPNA